MHAHCAATDYQTNSFVGPEVRNNHKGKAFFFFQRPFRETSSTTQRAMVSFLSMEALQQALSTDIHSLILSAATLGVLSHVSLFRSLPVEEHLYPLLGFYAAAVIAVAVAYLSLTQFTALQALFRVGCIAWAFNTGLASSIAIYRLFFHRLRAFPGPWLSKLSRFYDAYLAGRNVQYNVEIARLHEEYGDFIRTGTLALRCCCKCPSLTVIRTARDMHRSEIRCPSAPITPVEMRKVDFLCPGADRVEILLCPSYPGLR